MQISRILHFRHVPNCVDKSECISFITLPLLITGYSDWTKVDITKPLRSLKDGILQFDQALFEMKKSWHIVDLSIWIGHLLIFWSVHDGLRTFLKTLLMTSCYFKNKLTNRTFVD